MSNRHHFIGCDLVTKDDSSCGDECTCGSDDIAKQLMWLLRVKEAAEALCGKGKEVKLWRPEEALFALGDGLGKLDAVLKEEPE